MRRILSICCTLLIVSSVFAQSSRHHLELSVSEPFSSVSWLNYSLSPATEAERNLYQSWSNYALPNNYADQWYLLPLTLGYHYQVLDWMQVGLESGCMLHCTMPSTLYHQSPSEFYKNASLYIAPCVRFNYYHKNIVDLYSGLALGVNVKMYGTEANPMALCTARPTWQVTALGVRFGKQVYGITEIGYGYKGFFTMGIGYRF